MRTAAGAEFTCDGALEVAAAEFFWRTLAVAEALDGHQHEEIGAAAGDVLAFPAVALPLEHRVALGNVTHLSAIASAFQLHGLLLSPNGWSSLMRHAHACRLHRSSAATSESAARDPCVRSSSVLRRESKRRCPCRRRDAPAGRRCRE